MTKAILVLLFVLAATFFSFSSSLFNGFTDWDDDVHITENQDIRSLSVEGVKTIFTSTATHGYIPLTILSFAVEYHFFGLNPFVIHLDNLILHLLVTALIFFLGLRFKIDVWASGLTALLFGIHPMHVESVAWATERKDVLYAVFYLLAMHSHWTYLESQRKRFYALTIVCGLLSMLAKPMALSLPLILWILDEMKGCQWSSKVFLEKIPHFLYIIPLVLITYHIQADPSQASFYEAVLSWIWSLMFYIGKFLVPIHLFPLYVRPEPVSFLNPAYLAAIIFLSAWIFILIRFRNNRWLVFAGLFYFCSIFFLLRFNVSQISFVADRYMYLPSLGLCFLFGWGVKEVFVRLGKNKIFQKVLMVGSLVILFGALSAKTFAQCKIWKKGMTVWSVRNIQDYSDMLQNNPNSWLALYGRAKAYEHQEKWDLALADYDRVLTVKPDLGWAYNSRGTIFFSLGREEEALQDFNKGIMLEPTTSGVFNNRALIYFHRKQYESALRDLNKALELNPGSVDAYANRGLIYAEQNKKDLAIKDYNRGLQINPSEAKLYYYRSVAYANMKQFDAAMADAQKAKTLGYSNIDKHMAQLKEYIP